MKNITEDVIVIHMCTINGNHMMCGSWDIEHKGQNFLSFWTIFCPFTPLAAQKIKMKKMKKMPRNIIILHKCTINHDHMLYCSLDMVCRRCNYFSFWAIFCPFASLTAWKIEIFKKWKKLQEISSFYTSVPKTMIIHYTVPEIRSVTDVTIFILGYFLPI